MFQPTYRDWPKGYHQLLHYTVILAVLMLVIFWLGIYPRWHNLETLRKSVDQQSRALEKNDVQLDSNVLKAHIKKCDAILQGEPRQPGLVSVADDTIARATATFQDEIRSLYPGVSPEGLGPQEQFVANSTRIDYKDLSDRIKSEFKEKGIVFSEKRIETDSAEPVFHLMLKLWAIRHLVRGALACGLEVERNEEGEARISATRTLAFSLEKDNSKPYLLEFPVMLSLSGGMEELLSFMHTLQEGEVFLPVKNIRIHSQPPASIRPGERLDLKRLHFHLRVSAFFPMPSLPAAKAQPTATGGAKEN